MIFPTTNLASFLLLTLTLVCWGSWANMQKYLAKNRWRFELFYFDFAIGALLCTVVAAFTLGSMNSQELTFQDNLLITGYRQMAWAGAAGVVFNIGNMLLVGAIALAGMAVGFSISFGVAAVVGVIFAYASSPHMNPILTFGGMVVFLAAVAVAAFSYSGAAETLTARESNKPLRPDPRARNAPIRIGPARAIILSVVAGIFMGLSAPLVDMARQGENGISPYGIAILFGAGLFGCAVVAVPFFINFPVQGVPITAGTYFKGTMMQHIFGIFSGVVWGAGALAAWVTLGAPASVQAGPALTYIFLECSAVLAAIWGLLVWKDLAWSSRFRTYAGGALVLFLIGVGMVSAAYLK